MKADDELLRQLKEACDFRIRVGKGGAQKSITSDEATRIILAVERERALFPVVGRETSIKLEQI